MKTHLEPALSLTASFTCSMVDGFDAACLLPPMDANVAAPVAKSVPSARYSFLMARPKITLCPP
jgi:hypothetical protein